MKSYLHFLWQIQDLLGEDRRKLPWLMILFLSSSAMDILGLSIIGPYVSLAVYPEVEQNETLARAISFFGLPNEPQSLLNSNWYFAGGRLSFSRRQLQYMLTTVFSASVKISRYGFGVF